MGLLTFGINVTLDGCVDHQEGIADDETHAFFTRLLDEGAAMLWGRVTYEMMESYWPAVARGEEAAPPAMREWAVKLEAKPEYIVSSTRTDYPWSHAIDSRWTVEPVAVESADALQQALAADAEDDGEARLKA